MEAHACGKEKRHILLAFLMCTCVHLTLGCIGWVACPTQRARHSTIIALRGSLHWELAMKLLDQMFQILQVRHDSVATERCYCQYIRRFIFFQGVKHPCQAETVS